MLLVLTVLACATATLGQGFLPDLGNLGDIGADIGGRVGSGIGKGVGDALDNGLKVPGMAGGGSNIPLFGGGNRPTKRPGNVRPASFRDDTYSGGDSSSRRAYEDGSGSSGRRNYEHQGTGSEYENGRSYTKERTVKEREQRVNYGAGRDGETSSRDGYEGRSDNYRRDESNYDKRYENAKYDAGLFV